MTTTGRTSCCGQVIRSKGRIFKKVFDKTKDAISGIKEWEYYPDSLLPGPFGPPIPGDNNGGGGGFPIPWRGVPVR